MYEDFYGFADKPFSLTPDPKYLYRSQSHANAFDLLHYSIRRREGFVVVTGDIGTGKTTLCRALLEQIDRRTFTALVLNPFLSEEDLLKRILLDFGVISREELKARKLPAVSKQELIDAINDFSPRVDAVLATLGYPRRDGGRSSSRTKIVAFGAFALALGFIGVAIPVLLMAPRWRSAPPVAAVLRATTSQPPTVAAPIQPASGPAPQASRPVFRSDRTLPWRYHACRRPHLYCHRRPIPRVHRSPRRNQVHGSRHHLRRWRSRPRLFRRLRDLRPRRKRVHRLRHRRHLYLRRERARTWGHWH